MASIRDLLNPLPEPRQYQADRARRLETPPPLKTDMISPPREKRSKVVKDGAVFRVGTVQGELRYPPCEERDEHLTKIHTEWRLHPMGKIVDYPRHIPYQSEKKSFSGKTGRDSFHGRFCPCHLVLQSSADVSQCSSIPSRSLESLIKMGNPRSG